MAKLCHGLHVVSSLGPDVILRMGTNDLADLRSDVSGSEIEGLVRLFLNSYTLSESLVFASLYLVFERRSSTPLHRHLTTILSEFLSLSWLR